MQVEINPKQDEKVSIANMPIGRAGVDGKGNVYFRFYHAALCVPDTGKTYTDNANNVTDVYATLLPTGTEIVITL